MRRLSYARSLCPLLRAVIFGATLFCAASIAAAEKRVALVIGNSAYPMAPLKNPLNDARTIAKTLNQLGFEVLLKTNIGQRGMVEATREFSAKLKQGDIALFYYSGHGMQIRGRNYLIPVDADIRAEHEVPYVSFDVSQVLDALESARSRTNLVILDACRNNPYIRTFRSSRVGLAQMDAPSGTLIAFSTAPGSEARDGDTDLGTYTRHLVKHMSTPGLPVEILFRRVREGVTIETKDRQTPWESSSLRGDFYFAGPGGALSTFGSAPPAAAQQMDPAAVELAFWESIKVSTNREDFQEYLQAYPKGRFGGLARNRIQAIERQIATAPVQAKEPPKDREISFGKVVYVDDGICPPGELKEITGGSREKSIPRKVRCVKRPDGSPPR